MSTEKILEFLSCLPEVGKLETPMLRWVFSGGAVTVANSPASHHKIYAQLPSKLREAFELRSFASHSVQLIPQHKHCPNWTGGDHTSILRDARHSFCWGHPQEVDAEKFWLSQRKHNHLVTPNGHGIEGDDLTCLLNSIRTDVGSAVFFDVKVEDDGRVIPLNQRPSGSIKADDFITLEQIENLKVAYQKALNDHQQHIQVAAKKLGQAFFSGVLLSFGSDLMTYYLLPLARYGHPSPVLNKIIKTLHTTLEWGLSLYRLFNIWQACQTSGLRLALVFTTKLLASLEQHLHVLEKLGGSRESDLFRKFFNSLSYGMMIAFFNPENMDAVAEAMGIEVGIAASDLGRQLTFTLIHHLPKLKREPPIDDNSSNSPTPLASDENNTSGPRRRRV